MEKKKKKITKFYSSYFIISARIFNAEKIAKDYLQDFCKMTDFIDSNGIEFNNGLAKKFDSQNIIHPLQHADAFSARGKVLKTGRNIKDQGVLLY